MAIAIALLRLRTYYPSHCKTKTFLAPKDSDEGKQQNDAQEKAKIRRAQVRKAQIQHRQRKANYVQQLEKDLSDLRESIAQTQRDSLALAKENDAMKEVLKGTETRESLASQYMISPPTSAETQTLSVASPNPDMLLRPMEAQNLDAEPGDQETYPELFGDINVDDITVTLSIDETLGTPCFYISSSPSNTSAPSATSPSNIDIIDPGQLTPAQEQMAINFILALEHVCWDHYVEEHVAAVADQLEDAGGHALMASAYCVTHVPTADYAAARHDCSQQQQPPDLQWQSPGLTLHTLYGIAQSLNLGGDLEITPVQAWFELSSRYPPSLLLQLDIMEALKREFNGLVRCVYYGAVISRLDFETVVDRVLGPPVLPAT
ncbi:hypothetical protein S40293_05312 [Stachybotrys chartarum IBT 40293]|nr:hypothetical protein S40293_05312 [Stachybotrys chartarum IBT 40293]KFA78374.1 hypothetical protein S40288_04944 [Stachybotrys chartarum IBT 40288]